MPSPCPLQRYLSRVGEREGERGGGKAGAKGGGENWAGKGGQGEREREAKGGVRGGREVINAVQSGSLPRDLILMRECTMGITWPTPWWCDILCSVMYVVWAYGVYNTVGAVGVFAAPQGLVVSPPVTHMHRNGVIRTMQVCKHGACRLWYTRVRK